MEQRLVTLQGEVYTNQLGKLRKINTSETLQKGPISPKINLLQEGMTVEHDRFGYGKVVGDGGRGTTGDPDGRSCGVQPAVKELKGMPVRSSERGQTERRRHSKSQTCGLLVLTVAQH